MKVLFTTPILEHPAAGGPQLRIENSIKALSGACDLSVISRAQAPLPQLTRTAEFFRGNCTDFKMLPRVETGIKGSPRMHRIRSAARRLLNIGTTQDAEFILNYVDHHEIDVVWFGYGNISFALIKCVRKLRPNLKLVCDTDSVWSRFVLRELPYAEGLRKHRIRIAGAQKEREERAWVELCDVTTAVSEVDAEYYRGLTSHPDKVRLFANVIDVESYKTRPPRPAGFRSPSIYLAGSFGHFHSPMDSAARWVLESVLPLLLDKHPDLHFYIVGNNSDRGFGHLNGPNITATGRLDSVLPYLCNADVALVPLKFESGTRFKILEAGACSVPIVSTTLGAEGIPVVNGEHILIADDPKHFAAAILRIIEDKILASTIARNCNRLVRERYSVQALAAEARSILGYLETSERRVQDRSAPR